MSLSPLPSPANEFQADAINLLNEASRTIQKLQRFYRGHQKSTQSIDHALVQILSVTMSLDRLPWDPTNCENFDKISPASPGPLSNSQIEDLRHG